MEIHPVSIQQKSTDKMTIEVIDLECSATWMSLTPTIILTLLSSAHTYTSCRIKHLIR